MAHSPTNEYRSPTRSHDEAMRVGRELRGSRPLSAMGRTMSHELFHRIQADEAEAPSRK